VILSAILGFINISANNRAYVLTSRIDELYNSYTALQEENTVLQDLIAYHHQETNNMFDINNLPIQEDILTNNFLEQNPIDSFYYEMAQIIMPTSTFEMVRFEVLFGLAWRAEMDNFYEYLLSQTQSEIVANLLDGEKYYYVEYIYKRAELEALLIGSTAFWTEDKNISVGTITSVIYVARRAEMYREKALELYNRLNDLGMNPQFIFNEEYHIEKLQQEFPNLGKRELSQYP